MNLIKHVWELWRDGRVLELDDPWIGNSFSEQEVVRFIQVGILCMCSRKCERQAYNVQLVFMLGNEPLIPSLKQPAFVLASDSNSANACASPHSLNEMTISIIEGL
ncbi:hypothetical protein Scep_026211 [Stephania cephalantha]|uniref:Non-specific serine/threonine protein kinase n=1 Tax=Stephania cephalantha TaxID=152367 RepID=A0AAP0EPZ2_9MAGN